jgi:hypothetical protein
MARPKSTNPKSNADRQAAYRARKKAAGLKRKDDWINPLMVSKGKPSKEQEEIKKQWQKELEEEQLKAARKAGRKTERAKYQRKGYIEAMISIGNFFIRRERPDITKALLKNFNITRTDCTACGYGNYELQTLDKYHAFDGGEDKPI